MSVRRRSDRPNPAHRRRRWNLESLESRQLLTGGTGYYQPRLTNLPVQTGSVNLSAAPIDHPVNGISDAQVAALGNEGKVVTGTDRLGNRWSIAVYGPGTVIVTDATPNDGVLNDDIDTIQLVGTSPNLTHVIGSVSPSVFVTNQGEVFFNKLVAQQGVASIVLNGFVLEQTVAPLNGGLPNSNTGVFLLGGARQLEFSGIAGAFDTSTNPQPINVMIGSPTTPLPYQPNVRIDQISNTVFNSTTSVASVTPNTTPSVNIIINGSANKVQVVAAGQASEPAAEQYLFPVVGSTGRTSIQANGINSLLVAGSATNLSVSRSTTPFQGGFSGLSHVGTATFGGTADGLALDVAGKIGKVQFNRGLGSPVGYPKAQTSYGIPAANIGFAGNGLLGGLVRASSIGKVVAAPADSTLLTSSDPANQQLGETGFQTYYAKAGRAITNSAIVTTGDIGSVHVVGDLTTSEIKAGADLLALQQGLQKTLSPSAIRALKIRGDLLDSVVSASFQPGALGYGAPGSAAGSGVIVGRLNGSAVRSGLYTVLGNLGSGFYALVKKGSLPTA